MLWIFLLAALTTKQTASSKIKRSLCWPSWNIGIKYLILSILLSLLKIPVYVIVGCIRWNTIVMGDRKHMCLTVGFWKFSITLFSHSIFEWLTLTYYHHHAVALWKVYVKSFTCYSNTSESFFGWCLTLILFYEDHFFHLAVSSQAIGLCNFWMYTFRYNRDGRQSLNHPV